MEKQDQWARRRAAYLRCSFCFPKVISEHGDSVIIQRGPLIITQGESDTNVETPPSLSVDQGIDYSIQDQVSDSKKTL